MSRLGLVLLLAAALGCGNRQKSDSPPQAASAPLAAEARPTARLQRVPPPEGSATGSAQGATGERPSAQGSGGAVSPGLGASAPQLKGLLVPPATPGEARVALDGCLAQPSEEAGARFPAPAATRGPQRAAVTVEPLGTGVLVVHELVHGCCLQADVSSSLEGRTVTLTETLRGQSCRCRCASTVRAAVGLPPGDYTLRVVTEQPGQRTVAHEAALTVRRGP